MHAVMFFMSVITVAATASTTAAVAVTATANERVRIFESRI